MICVVKEVLGEVSAVLAFLAAMFWLKASWIGPFTLPEKTAKSINSILVKQTRLNSAAAFCAAMAALCQIAAVKMPLCLAFS
jgi:hypothetical protein